MKRNKIICLLLALALVLTMPAATTTAAKKKTTDKKASQSKKVALNKKKLTLKKGKTYQLKLKNLKKGKKVKWSTNKKKIATVSKKGKVKAKKAGKAVITAKVGKKKYKCKVTVKNKTASKTTIASVVVLNRYTVQVVLNKAQSLSASNFTVKTKAYASGTYNRTLKMDGVTTSNKKTYIITLSESSAISETDYVQVTVSKLKGTGTASKQTIYSRGKFNYQDTQIYTSTQGQEVDKYFDLDGYGWSTASVTGLPAGVKAKMSDSGGSIEFYGTPSRAGSFTGKIVTKDELGNTYTNSIIWLVGNANTIVAAYRPIYRVMGSSGCYIDQSIYITGGSGSYEYAIQGNGYGMSVYGDGELEGTLKSAGNYAITVGITDKDNASRKATARLSVSFAAGRTISGIVKDAKGNPLEDAEVDFTNRNRADRYLSSAYDYTDSKGAYSVTLVNGTYDIDASMTNASRHILSYKVTTSKSGVDIALPVYPVMVYSNNSAVSSFGSWYDSTGTYYGSGNKLYLKAGTYQLTSTFSRGLVDYTAKISLKVTAATTSVTAAVTGKSNLSVTGDISLGEAVTVTNASDYRYYRFVPTETKTYYFYSEGSVDSYGLLCNTNGEELASDDDSGTTGGNFLISYECTAGTAYYIRISSYGDESSFNLFVSDTNPASYEGE